MLIQSTTIGLTVLGRITGVIFLTWMSSSWTISPISPSMNRLFFNIRCACLLLTFIFLHHTYLLWPLQGGNFPSYKCLSSPPSFLWEHHKLMEWSCFICLSCFIYLYNQRHSLLLEYTATASSLLAKEFVGKDKDRLWWILC